MAVLWHKHKFVLKNVSHLKFLFTPGYAKVVYDFTCELCGQKHKVNKEELYPGLGLISTLKPPPDRTWVKKVKLKDAHKEVGDPSLLHS